MEHAEIVESAFVAYLETVVIANSFPDDLLIYPGENNLDKSGQRIVCYIPAGDMGEEDPPNSGNRWAEIEIQLRTPYSKLTAAEKANGVPEPLDQHKAVAASLAQAMALITDTALDAAVNNICVMGITSRTQLRDQEENGWVSGWRVRLLSAPSAFN